MCTHTNNLTIPGQVGQHCGSLEYLLPIEYTTTLSKLHSRAPESAFEDVCKVIEADLGKDVRVWIRVAFRFGFVGFFVFGFVLFGYVEFVVFGFVEFGLYVG